MDVPERIAERQPEIPIWAQSRDGVLSQLTTSLNGLSADEAATRLAAHGMNSVSDDQMTAAWRLLLRQIANPLVVLLLFGAVVSALLQEWIDAAIIATIVAGSALLGFAQEYRASKALSQLRQRLALNVRAKRNGAWTTVPVDSIVPGDIVQLTAGNLVPADAVVLEARDFLVSEAALTGESFPVEKSAGTVAPDATVAKRTNCVFLGTSVRSGSATVAVSTTGPRTILGGIAGRLAQGEEETEFARGLRQFGYMLSKVMIAVALFISTVNMLMHRPPVDSLLFAVALAVGLSPELLPAIVSVTLAAGARRLASQGVLVRKLEAIENLGSIGILCTDKTGTLTKGDVELSAAVGVSGDRSDAVLRLAFINASLETGIANPLDLAIEAAGAAHKLTVNGARKLDEIPYDFIRKRLSIVVAGEDGASAQMITKGAVPNVLGCCTTFERDGTAVALDAAMIGSIDTFCETKGRQGYRILALASRQIKTRQNFGHDDETGMKLEGFLLFLDPLKEGIVETVQALKDVGIAVKIISGDNRHTAAHVGAMIGLDPAKILTGQQIAKLSGGALWHLAERTDIFAEIDPQQKEGIVRALQKRGHAVGYMGDGINDAPALLAADAGISVDDAVDVARESADIVLLRPDLNVLRSGIVDGRRTFENTLKYIKLTVSANFGNMISMAVASMFLPFLPLSAKQILLNNFLSDIPSLAISTDRVDAVAVERPQRWRIRDVRSFMIVFGLISSAFDMLTFYVLLHVFNAGEQLFQSTWFVESVLTELAVVFVLRTRLAAWQSRPSVILVVASAVIACVAIAIPYLGEVATVFGLGPIPAPLLAAAVAIVIAYAAATEAAKHVLHRYMNALRAS